MAKSPLLEKVRDQLRAHHDSLRTEESYVQWIKRYILFHGKRHPSEMGEQEITAFLTLPSREEECRGIYTKSSVIRNSVSL